MFEERIGGEWLHAINLHVALISFYLDERREIVLSKFKEWKKVTRAWLFLSLVGESMDLGNTFWQADFGKKRKKLPRPRFYQALDRGLQTSTEVLSSPRPRFFSALSRGTSVQ